MVQKRCLSTVPYLEYPLPPIRKLPGDVFASDVSGNTPGPPRRKKGLIGPPLDNGQVPAEEEMAAPVERGKNNASGSVCGRLRGARAGTRAPLFADPHCRSGARMSSGRFPGVRVPFSTGSRWCPGHLDRRTCECRDIRSGVGPLENGKEKQNKIHVFTAAT